MKIYKYLKILNNLEFHMLLNNIKVKKILQITKSSKTTSVLH